MFRKYERLCSRRAEKTVNVIENRTKRMKEKDTQKCNVTRGKGKYCGWGGRNPAL
jgi:hypothetical protein